MSPPIVVFSYSIFLCSDTDSTFSPRVNSMQPDTLQAHVRFLSGEEERESEQTSLGKTQNKYFLPHFLCEIVDYTLECSSTDSAHHMCIKVSHQQYISLISLDFTNQCSSMEMLVVSVMFNYWSQFYFHSC